MTLMKNKLCFSEDAVQGWLSLPAPWRFSTLGELGLVSQRCKLPVVAAAKSSKGYVGLNSSNGCWSCPLQSLCVVEMRWLSLTLVLFEIV